MNIVGLPALVDTYENYIWVLHNQTHAWVLDPGEAQPVIDYLDQHELTLQGILITHRHPDHVNGVTPLLERYSSNPPINVYGGRLTPLDFITQRLDENDQIELADNFHLKVLFTPGHTEDHISFYNNDCLFCGDTLFTGGCGRVLGGTLEQFADSILKIRQLPDHTKFYCGHEYTQTNLEFAQLVEPDNQALQQRITTTVIDYPKILNHPQASLAEEKATNPFMRFDLDEVTPQLIARGAQNTPASLFATLRAWKDDFDRNH